MNTYDDDFVTDAAADYMKMSGIFSANSNHTGGVNCGLMDGSVQFVSDTITSLNTGKTWADADTNKNPTGASLYGVWGALGTPSSGESSPVF